MKTCCFLIHSHAKDLPSLISFQLLYHFQIKPCILDVLFASVDSVMLFWKMSYSGSIFITILLYDLFPPITQIESATELRSFLDFTCFFQWSLLGCSRLDQKWNTNVCQTRIQGSINFWIVVFLLLHEMDFTLSACGLDYRW